jgi:signal transduction histidine kinase
VIKRSERLALLGHLSGGLAHSLRNSVTGARMAVQLHQRHCHDVDQESLAVSLRQLAMTEEHLQRFLAVGQPQPPRQRECDLRRIIDDVSLLVGPACRHRKVELKPVTGPDSLPVRVDTGQLGQLLLNLLLNAIEAAGSGGWVQVLVTEQPGERIRLSVLDSGPGPPGDVCERLFEPFVTGKPEGIGLGLTLARQIAQAHGGSLRFTRERYTCFELELPTGATTRREKVGVRRHAMEATR